MRPLKLSPLIEADKIEKRIQEISSEIAKEISDDEEVVAICVLKGSFVFYSDLIRNIEQDIQCEFMGVSSYGSSTKSSGEVKVTLDLMTPIKGKTVILVEDIVDTGLTMNFLQRQIQGRDPKKLISVSLLLKPAALKTECELQHVGFEIDNHFVVGYGLDYNGLYRNLPYIAQAENLN